MSSKMCCFACSAEIYFVSFERFLPELYCYNVPFAARTIFLVVYLY